MALSWKLPFGARVTPDGAFFRVWAPESRSVSVVLDDGARRFPLRRQPGGWFSGRIRPAHAGTRYRYALDDGGAYADPASRFQPEGPFGPSLVVDPAAFRWSDRRWRGVKPADRVIYEMHIGAFTREGTFDAARRQLKELRRCGITLLEILPIADWAGSRNWGYDGVNFYAPTRCYGGVDSFKRFVDEAHANGLGVLLDVVYNHYGPDGNFLARFSRDYESRKHTSEWGPTPNYDGKNAAPVREFFVENACYWISEFHLDGLRLDATQGILDEGPVHLMAELAERAREAAEGRDIFLVGENEPQHAKLIRPRKQRGYGLDALWADDFHHAARVALTGFRDAYFTDYRGTAQELAASVKNGFLFQGQYYTWQKNPRGTPTRGLEPQNFVFYLQNHDQVANHLQGVRTQKLGPLALYRALTALTLLGPSTPMLFMGQEFESASPFHFFIDHSKALTPLIDKGRREWFKQFASYKSDRAQKQIPLASDERSFERSKLDFAERRKHAAAYRFHRDLLALRRRWRIGELQYANVEAAALTDQVLVLRYRLTRGGEALLAVNLGGEYAPAVQPEPLLAPPEGKTWKLVWQSGGSRYGRRRFRPRPERWRVPAQTALFFVAPC